MAKEPLFFKDTGEMGDVFLAATKVIEQARFSREERVRVVKISEERINQLTGKFIEYDTVNAQNTEYQNQVGQVRVKLLKGELTGDDARSALNALAGDREELRKKYGDLAGLLDTQMNTIDLELKTLGNQELALTRERDKYHSALHPEVKWIAEAELKEIARLIGMLTKRRQSLADEKSLITIRKDELAESLAPVEPPTLVKPISPVETNEPVEPPTLVEPIPPVETDEPVEPPTPVEPISPVETGGLVESSPPVDDVISSMTKRYVRVDDARIHELTFIARFDTKMNAYPVKCFSPREEKTYTVTEWKNHYHYDSVTADNASRAATTGTDNQDIPQNVGSVYAIDKKEFIYFGKRKKTLVIDAFSFCNTGDYAELGYDTRMVTLSALMSVLIPIIQRAEDEDYFHVLGITSPTGWDNRVIAWVKGEDPANSYMSRNVAVCLVDAGSGEVYYNPTDLRILSYIDYFRPEFDIERVEKMKNMIRVEFATAEYLEFEKIAKKTGEDRFIIEKAFYALEREKLGRVKFITGGAGLVFMR